MATTKVSHLSHFIVKISKVVEFQCWAFSFFKGKYHFKAENHSKGKSERSMGNVIVFKHFKQNFIMLMASKNVLLGLVLHFPAIQVNGENKMYNTAASYLTFSITSWYSSINALPIFFVQPGDSCLSWEVLFCKGFLQKLHSKLRSYGFVLGKVNTLFLVSIIYEVAFPDCFGGKVRVLFLALGTLLCLDVLVPLGSSIMVSWRDPRVFQWAQHFQCLWSFWSPLAAISWQDPRLSQSWCF